jgi:Ser/Thr protein kinase RdoA (MazF antagonist)
LARTALVEQGVTVERLRWMGPHTNHLFRCATPTGDRLVVRVCLPGGRSDAELDAELAWLAALARDTDLTVPVPRFSTRVATPKLPAGGRCIAFGWVGGRHCERRPSRRLVADLGRVLATCARLDGLFAGSFVGFSPLWRPLLLVMGVLWCIPLLRGR